MSTTAQHTESQLAHELPGDSFVSSSHLAARVQGLKIYLTAVGFLYGFWGLNPGGQSCETNILTHRAISLLPVTFTSKTPQVALIGTGTGAFSTILDQASAPRVQWYTAFSLLDLARQAS